jgi:hypothetical protein
MRRGQLGPRRTRPPQLSVGDRRLCDVTQHERLFVKVHLPFRLEAVRLMLAMGWIVRAGDRLVATGPTASAPPA